MASHSQRGAETGRAAAPRGGSLWRGVLLVLGLLAGTTLGIGLVARLRGLMLEDDAFIFVRYAGNLLAHHAITWNPGGPATYGTTSLLHLFLVAAVRAVAGPSPSRVAVLASFVAGLLFLAALGHVVWRRILHRAPAGPLLAVLLLLPLATSIETLAAHFVTGMDTTLAMFYVVLVLCLAARYEAEASPARATAVALAAGGAWAARPDLTLLAAPVVIALLVSPVTRARRSLGWRLAGVTLGVLGLQWVLCGVYFGTPVPLSFYVKSAVRYGAGMDAAYAAVPGRELGQFVQSYWLYLLLIAVAIAGAGKRRRWVFSAAETGALAGGLAFVLYYRFFVLQVMPHYHRFYYPTLPVWVVLGARAAATLARDRLPVGGWRALAGRRPVAAAGLLLALAAAVLLVRPWPRWMSRIGQRPWFTALPAVQNLDGWSRRWWFRLEDLSALPNDIVWATTEIGLPGALNPGRTIVDLSGLNEIEFARHGFDADELFRRATPDLIYMPHPDYRELTAELVRHPRFRAEYDYLPARALGTRLALAVWRGGAHYAEIRAVLERGPEPAGDAAPSQGR
jgi:hypothetical protein